MTTVLGICHKLLCTPHMELLLTIQTSCLTSCSSGYSFHHSFFGSYNGLLFWLVVCILSLAMQSQANFLPMWSNHQDALLLCILLGFCWTCPDPMKIESGHGWRPAVIVPFSSNCVEYVTWTISYGVGLLHYVSLTSWTFSCSPSLVLMSILTTPEPDTPFGVLDLPPDALRGLSVYLHPAWSWLLSSTHLSWL